MTNQQAPEWFTVLILFVILLAIFPIAAQMILGAILWGILIGIIIGGVILIIWWYLENKDNLSI